MSVGKCLHFAALTAALLIANSSASAALLEGHQVFSRLEHQDTISSSLVADEAGPVVVGPGLEANDLGTKIHTQDLQNSVIVDIDFSDTQIVITAVNDQPPSFIERIRMSVFDAPQISVRLNPATNWAGFDNSIGRLTEIAQNIEVNLVNLSGLAGQQIVIDVVPEPAAAALLAVASPALLAAHRRRRLRHA